MPAPDLTTVLRLLLALFLAGLGEFCLFGAIASRESSNYLPWLIGYSILSLSFFACAARAGIGALEINRSNLTYGITGIILGGALAFALSFVMFMMGPRWASLGASASVTYAILAAPIGAAIGGLSGVWIGARLRNNRIDENSREQ